MGGLLTARVLLPEELTLGDWQLLFERGVAIREPTFEKKEVWPPRELGELSDWCYWKVDDEGWTTGWVGTFDDLGTYLDGLERTTDEVVIPVLPTVYKPQLGDKLYYDYLLTSDIAKGDKVLVIGCGSGADSWMVARKTESTVYVVDINPMSVINTKSTARIAGFDVKGVAGDIRTVELPADFRDFDYVLWNMPFVHLASDMEMLQGRSFHDGDDGSILTDFLELLPSLLKEDGKAILLNLAPAEQFITTPGVTKQMNPGETDIHNSTYMLFVVPNPATAVEEEHASDDAQTSKEPRGDETSAD